KGVRLSLLRSVRAYTNTLSDYSETLVSLSQAEAAVDKAREAVVNVLWFFDNKELSTRALERQDRELYNQWFQQAKQQWDNFSENKGLPLRAIDQPRTLALERTFTSEPPAPNYMKYLPLILLMGFLVMLLYFVFARQMKGVGGSAMNFGKSPAKMLDKGMSTVTFKDVAGCDEAKEELQEIVDFLKNPSKFTALGGRIPKGVLCIGPPGTGKTLIAKAVAGEANRPFFSISGSDFVEMFVGVGASRIRDLFNQAKKQAPCIVFIDEIDAVGRHRGGGYGGGHDEREQTLNQLLVEMDGFDTNEGVILVAATNRPDVLDKALLRPGRFDRRVTIDLPDIKGRHEILKVHARAIKIDPSVDLMAIARMTPGCSGADLANLLNEAALLAARKGRSAVTPSDTLEAADKVRYGKERRTLEIDPSEKRTTAYHESGHAIVGFVCEHSDPVDKVTVIPRGFSLGATHFLPEKNRLSYWKQEVIDHLAVAMGGRVAEELFVGDISSGAQQDIAQATQLARSMVCEWGMSDSLGLVAYGDRQGGAQYLGLPGMTEKTYSEATAQAIDTEVRRITDNAYAQAKKICQEHRAQIELMTEMLIEFETLDREDIKKIMNGSWNTDEKRQKLEKAAAAHTRPTTPKKEIAPVLPGQPKEQPSA
ncbi:MAG: ATP-dependent zinc metalloprotease FtsH, partial [Verrucomicrobia bacterium]|nr:ATP-dependent zinc metalloprotease FtsH [Verrucomicrobiota bacterium]